MARARSDSKPGKRTKKAPEPRTVLVTGAGGYIGAQVVAGLAAAVPAEGEAPLRVVAADVREIPAADRLEGVIYETADVRSPGMADLFQRHGVDTVVHLAAIVTPGKKPDRRLEFEVDVLGTRNVLEACLQVGATQLVVTSSGAAYGYHADNPDWLDEDDLLRGNTEFAYSDHKRQVEQILARYRRLHPALRQLIFRPGVVLGTSTRNQITDLWDARRVIGLRGADTPFVIIWDQDVVAIIVQGVLQRSEGIYNLAGDGVLTMREIARLMGKPYVPLPVTAVRGALWALKRLGRTQYGPEQVDFLRYRPVLSNRRLKEEFGYVPRKSTREVFELFLEGRRDVATP